MSVMRAKIAEHMTLSKRTSAHVTTVHKVDMTKIARIRDRQKTEFQARYGFGLTYLPFVIRAASEGIRQFPIVNASIEYTHPDWGTARLLYLTADDQIASIGTFGLPDIIETRRNQLDAVLIMPLDRFGIPLRAKLSLSNLLNDPVEYTQGGETQERYTTGVSVGFSLTYSR